MANSIKRKGIWLEKELPEKINYKRRSAQIYTKYQIQELGQTFHFNILEKHLFL